MSIRNLKSVENETVEITLLSVLYDPNGPGKSTFIHGLFFFRAVVLNPVQFVDNPVC